jgi:anti-anti-sigma factor
MIVDMVTRELSLGITAITFTGRLVLGNRLTEVEHTVRERIRQGSRKLLLDFSGLDFIDSAGVGVLAVCIGSMQREGGTIVVAGATGRVKQLLELTNLHRIVGLHADVASAHSALGE